MQRMRLPALTLAALALAHPAWAQSDITGDAGFFARLQAGILCVDGTGRHEPAPETRLGYVNLVDGQIVLGLATRRVPAIRDLAFGVVALVADTGGQAGVSIVVTHPPMGSDGSTRDVWQNDFVAGEQSASFFRFEYPEELVTGDWTIQARAGDKVFYTARFQVVDPGAMPGFVNPCLEPPPIS
jgi:hypothetical protein